jgi:hypothetical protein
VARSFTLTVGHMLGARAAIALFLTLLVFWGVGVSRLGQRGEGAGEWSLCP